MLSEGLKGGVRWVHIWLQVLDDHRLQDGGGETGHWQLSVRSERDVAFQL